MKSRISLYISSNSAFEKHINSEIYHYFYKITNCISNKYYYGIHSTNNLYDGYKGSGTALRTAYKKYGIDNFRMDILLFFNTREEAAEYESKIVNAELITDSNCYNIIQGGFNSYITNNSNSNYDHNLGKIWINNSIKNKIIDPKDLDNYLNNGWKLGEIHKSTKDKRVVSKPGYSDRFIYKEELQNYISGGWILKGTSRNKGKKSFAKNQIWITDGSRQKRINKEELSKYTETGWTKGVIQKTNKGRVRINNGIIEKIIDKTAVNSYINDGWSIGSLYIPGMLNKMNIHRDTENKIINKADLASYIKMGWSIGKYSETKPQYNLGKIAVYKDGVTRMIYKNDLQKYLKLGWSKGCFKKIKSSLS